MCDPLTFSLITAGIGAASTVAGGMAANQTAKAQARVYEIEGRQALQVGNIEANKVREAGQVELGQARAIQAKAGVDLGAGSAADVGADIAGAYEQDALMALYGGRLRAWQKQAAASQARFEGKQALTSSFISGAGTLLGGAVEGGLFASKPYTGGKVKITPQRGYI